MLPLVSAIVLFIIISIILGNEISIVTILGNLLSLQGICVESLVSPFWSLSYEVWFYIFLGSVGLVITNANYSKKLGGLILFLIVAVVFVSGLKAHYLLIWLMGAVAYLAKPLKFNIWIFILSIVGLSAFVALWQISSDSNTFAIPYGIKNKEMIELFLSLFFCLFIQHVILIKPTSKVTIFMESRLGYLACFSYTLYLCHRIIFLPIYEYIYDKGTYDMSFINILRWLSVILISLTVSYLIYFIAEKHTANVKRLIKKKLNIR